MDKRARRSVGYPWYVVGVLLLVFVLSYFDRYVLTLVIEPIKRTLHLSDFQVGLLLGPAFSIFNVAMSIPLGWYADRASRKWILLVGIVLWCTMTTGSAFATTFGALLLLRFGLGLGEAVVTPCSVSMISDYFERDRRARAISIYMAGPYLGTGLAFLIGGNLVGWLARRGDSHLLGFGPFEAWQMALFMVGLAGFVVAALMLTVAEPVRTDRIAATDRTGRSAIHYIAARWQGFGALFVGANCNIALAALTFWNVPLFQRVYGWNIAAVGTVTGLFYFTAGPIGTAIAVWASRRLGRTHRDGALRVLLLGLLVAVPTSILYPVMPNATLAVVAMFIAFIGKSIATAGSIAALSLVTPGDIRSRAAAIFNTVVTLVGPLLAPPLIGWAVDLSENPKSIGVVLSVFVLAIGIPSILVVLAGMNYYRRAVQELEASIVHTPSTGEPS